MWLKVSKNRWRSCSFRSRNLKLFFARPAPLSQRQRKGVAAELTAGFVLPRQAHLVEGATTVTRSEVLEGAQVSNGWSRPFGLFHRHSPGLSASCEPLIYGRAANAEHVVCGHLAHALIQGAQNSQSQVLTVGFAHDSKCSLSSVKCYKTINWSYAEHN